MKSRNRWIWIIGASIMIILVGPSGRYLAIIPGGRWVILLMGIGVGFGIGTWWREGKEGEDELLRKRLIRGELRLSEYRLLCRELGISKKKPFSSKKEKDFSLTDGT